MKLSISKGILKNVITRNAKFHVANEEENTTT